MDGNLITEWGSDGTGDGQFKEIIDGIAVDNDGYVYVVDFGNHRVQKFDSNGAFITKWGSQGTSNGQFILPWAIEVNNGLVYVSDSDRHNIQIFTTEGEFVKKWETQGFNAPRGIAIDKSGNVFVCNAQGNILKLTSSGQFISKFGTPGSDPGSMASPHGIAVDSIGRLFVADMNNNRIQVFTKISVNP